MKLILAAFLTVWLHRSWAQDSVESTAAPELPPPQSVQHPAVRPRPPDDPNKESSSFIGDPENLDPLRSRQDNLKEDAEPVLEDIRQVLDAPAPVNAVEEGFQPSASSEEQQAANVPASEVQPGEPKKVEPPKKTVVKAPKKTKKAKAAKKEKPSVIRMDDDPDEVIEQAFYQNYMRYNSEPTSIEAWSAATFGRSEEVYIVQKGDTLWSISETLFGDSLFWPKIWALNRQGIVNPHFIIPGMVVRFFPGSPEEAPTLAVGGDRAGEDGFQVESGSDSGGDRSAVVEGSFEASVPDFESSADDGEWSDSAGSSSAKRRKSFAPAGGTLVASSANNPTSLPPSIPVYRSSRYFEIPRKVELIDLAPPERIFLAQQADIFLTDRFVLSDLKISLESNVDLNCMPGETVRKFEYIRRTPTDEYAILEPLPKVVLDKEKKKPQEFLYPYRRIGTISHYGEGKLRIKDCKSILSRDLTYVPTSVIDSLKTRKGSERPPQVIGGPDVMNQKYFHEENMLYLDMGSLNFEVGQLFGIISERIDASAGQVKILDRFGAYAVGVVAHESNPIVVGDKVVPQ